MGLEPMLLQLVAALRAANAVLAKQGKGGATVRVEDDRCRRKPPELSTGFLATPAIARCADDGLAGRFEYNLAALAGGGKVLLVFAQAERSGLSLISNKTRPYSTTRQPLRPTKVCASTAG
jgi:hypothetical protein